MNLRTVSGFEWRTLSGTQLLLLSSSVGTIPVHENRVKTMETSPRANPQAVPCQGGGTPLVKPDGLHIPQIVSLHKKWRLTHRTDTISSFDEMPPRSPQEGRGWERRHLQPHARRASINKTLWVRTTHFSQRRPVANCWQRHSPLAGSQMEKGRVPKASQLQAAGREMSG